MGGSPCVNSGQPDFYYHNKGAVSGRGFWQWLEHRGGARGLLQTSPAVTACWSSEYPGGALVLNGTVTHQSNSALELFLYLLGGVADI